VFLGIPAPLRGGIKSHRLAGEKTAQNAPSHHQPGNPVPSLATARRGQRQTGNDDVFEGSVQQAREAARRTQCKNNLKQMGLAMHNYLDVYKRLPISQSWSNRPEGSAISACWARSLLPYVDQANITNSYNDSLPHLDPANRDAISRSLPLYKCPSSPAGDVIEFTVDSGWAGASSGEKIKIGVNEYACSANSQVTGLGGMGSMTYHDPLSVKISDITDGLSNTLLVVEISGGEFTYNTKREVVSTNTSVHWKVWPGFSRLSLRGYSRDGAVQHGGNCVVNCNSDGANPFSFHVGGAQVLLGDGSCRFLSENLDLTTMVRLVIRDDGQPLGEF